MMKKQFHDITIIFSERADGNMAFYAGRGKERALSNRKVFFKKANLSLNTAVFLQQSHSDHIQVVGKGDCGRGVKSHEDALVDTDALITDETGVVLGVQVADCVPVAVWDETTGYIAIVHAGWRGMAKHIVAKTVQQLQVASSEPYNFHAWIGPSAGPCCFELGEEEQKQFSHVRDGKVDLWREAQDQLVSGGLNAENIESENTCTICDDRFFSFRREGENAGRMIAGIVHSKEEYDIKKK